MSLLSRYNPARFSFDQVQLILVFVFLLINIVLFTHANYSRPYPDGPLISPTYLNAADGQRYWQVAINLAAKFSFSVPPLWDSRPEYPLTRSGPLPAMLFALPIRLVGLENAVVLIVAFQCLFLYLMSLSVRTLATPFGVSPNLLQGLILFNPNLIGLSHLAQSDLLFSGVFTVLVCYLTRMLIHPKALRLASFLVLGLLLALITMIRDIGYLFSLFFPFLLLITISCSPPTSRPAFKNLVVGLLAGALVYILITLPWTVRNHLTFEQFSPVVGQVEQLHYNYLRIKYLEGGNSSQERSKYIETRIKEILLDKDQAHCLDNALPSTRPDCRREIRNAYLSAILSESKFLLGAAIIYATARTLITSGSTRLISYLGLDNSNPLLKFMDSFEGFAGFSTYFHELRNGDPRRLLLTVACFVFILVTRLSGLVGLVSIFRAKSDERHLHVLYLLVMVIFLIGYFTVSTSRFRAPLEPILMLYAAIGIKMTSLTFRRKMRARRM